MAKRVVSLVVSLSLAAAFAFGAACTTVPDRNFLPVGDAAAGGGSDDGGGSHAGGASGTGGRGGGGGGGGGGSGATGDAGNGDAGGDGIECGASHCRDFASPTTTFSACCAGPAKDRCGLDTSPAGGGFGCLELNQPGAADTTCPSKSAGSASTAVTLPGCCLDRSATCGVEFSVRGGPSFGCVDIAGLAGTTAQSCTLACSKAAGPCQDDTDCCDVSPDRRACVFFGGDTTGKCTSYCTSKSDCGSGCCLFLGSSGRGACSTEASQCPTACVGADEACSTDADCCTGTLCVSSGGPGPRICRPSCSKAADCAPEFCMKDDVSGHSTCSRTYAGLCSDTCVLASNGKCQDGGPVSESGLCALGTDCTDCARTTGVAARLGGVGRCKNTCATKGDGVCNDGGAGAKDYSCSWGTDCQDCGPRLGICTDDCGYTDGICDDGAADATTSACAPGTDCTDCGVLYGGRNQTQCDGTKSIACTPQGNAWLEGGANDGVCECSDCPWDTDDCGVKTNACDGKKISSCCSPSNPCGFKADGICDCGGWCEWETSDCVAVGGPKCNGTGNSYCNFHKSDRPDGVCNCGGSCSFEGTDCALEHPGLLCTDTCSYAGDGTCDDDSSCAWGTDCADCGARKTATPL